MKDHKKDEIDLALDDLKLETDVDLDKLIEKKINRRIRKIALKTVIIVVAILILIFLCISPVMNLMNTNPAKLNKDGGTNKSSTLVKVYDAWLETNYPLRELDEKVTVAEEGFGNYTIKLHVFNTSEKIIAGDEYNVILKIKRSKVSIDKDTNNLLTNKGGMFYTKGMSWMASKTEQANIINEIKKLPESAYVDLVVSGVKPRDTSSLKRTETNDLSLEWYQVYQPSCDFQGGIAASKVKWYSGKERDKMTSAELNKAYIRNLKTLRDNKELWADLGLFSGNKQFVGGEYDLNNNIKAAEKSGVIKCKNYCVRGTKEAILEYIEKYDNDINMINVINVQLSTL